MHKTNFALKMLAVVFAVLVISNPAMADEKPEIFAQLGHSNIILSIAFSPDGKYLLSGSADNTIKLWDVATGREIRTFTGHTAAVESIAFSPDGKHIISAGCYDKSLKLWEVATGKEVRTFLGHQDKVNEAAFSPDGKYIISGGGNSFRNKDFALRLWEANTGKEIRTFTGHDNDISDIAFSPDGKYIASVSVRTIKLWETATGKEIKTFAEEKEFVKSIAFSPNGQYILLGSSDKMLRLLDVASGSEIKTFTGHEDYISSVAFSPDGKYALSGSSDKTLKLWEVSTGKEVRTFTGHTENITSVAFAPDGKHIASGSYYNLKLWDMATGREIRTFSGYTDKLRSVAFSPDGKYVVSGNYAYPIMKLWDVAAAREIKAFGGHKDYITSVAFSPDNKYVLSGSADKTLKLWDIATEEELKTFTGHTEMVLSVAFSPNGKYALSGSGDKTLKLWDVASGDEIRTFTGYENCVWSVAFSPDGKYALSGGGNIIGTTDFALWLWKIKSGEKVRVFTGHKGVVWSVAFSPDGKYIASGSYQTIKVWNTKTGRDIKTFVVNNHKYFQSVAFSPDGKYLLAGSDDKSVRLWDIGTEQEIKTLFGHEGDVRSVAFSPDGEFGISGALDGTVAFWNIAGGKEIVKFISFKNDEWIAITPEGFYNSSANGDRHLNVRIGNNVYGIDQYRSVFYKPEVVEAALRLGDSQQAITQVLGSDKQSVTVATMQGIEPPVITIKSPQDNKKITGENTQLALEVKDRNHPLKKVSVYVNGRTASEGTRGISVVATTGAIKLAEGQKTLTTSIPVTLERGENVIEVIAFNGFAEAKKTIRIYSEAEQTLKPEEVILPNLWILAIGVNQYQDKKINSLDYPADDAQGIVKAFTGQKGRLFRDVKSLVLSDHSSTKPTYENVIDNLEYLSQAGSNDVVVLFIAGHGINDDRGNYYFLPCDTVLEKDGSIKKSKAISWQAIKNVLDLPAKKLVFVDTCHAEGAGGKKTRGVDNNRLVKELQDANAVIFTSSRGKELSQESDQWKHGAFTYAIIEGISGKADLIKDNKISMKELDTYVSETVPQITNGAQHPITITPDGYVNFPVALIK
ncbi:MAG: caspase family protein [Proteobacteria bacterium]|nr:hypothetical protein [Desulfobacteraceae bacterium]MBU4011891.1 caspase family protein [Pseudomonadota bacterium]MBU4066752.1 caspase family protein [Pseudomonadota bacterium]